MRGPPSTNSGWLITLSDFQGESVFQRHHSSTIHWAFGFLCSPGFEAKHRVRGGELCPPAVPLSGPVARTSPSAADTLGEGQCTVMRVGGLSAWMPFRGK